jgi:hypothetical protein
MAGTRLEPRPKSHSRTQEDICSSDLSDQSTVSGAKRLSYFEVPILSTQG